MLGRNDPTSPPDEPCRKVPCVKLECPFEAALEHLKEERQSRIRVEQSIVENYDRLSDAFMKLFKQRNDDALDIQKLREHLNAQDERVEDIGKLVRSTNSRVKSVKYWLAAVVAALGLAAPVVEHLFGLWVHK